MPACSGVREALWLLQRLQAATTLFQTSRPPWQNGRTWSRESALDGKRAPQYMHRFASRRNSVSLLSGGT
jgi:hypothetical protein